MNERKLSKQELSEWKARNDKVFSDIARGYQERETNKALRETDGGIPEPFSVASLLDRTKAFQKRI
ncbi:MAG: hypothetical protein KGI08_09970 [Thaumarchaeota archaeon]|nr:hypothetical protein [Nitrososphaerota archaeon]